MRVLSNKAIRNKNIIRVILLLTGAVFIIAGIMQGDYDDTLAKAIRICLECIGIG